jgi:hypothetical protein
MATPEPPAGDRPRTLPPTWRWGALGWLVVWTPLYALTWGWRNFLALCDVAVVLGCLGLARSNRLLVGSQALPTMVVGVLWTTDLAARQLTGKHLFGGTEYMFDQRVWLPIRLLSLFHLALPVVLVLAVRRLGYDRRALPLQAGITLVLLVAARLVARGQNLNYVYRDPIFRRSLGPVPLHLALILVGTVVLIYLPAHLALRRLPPR